MRHFLAEWFCKLFYTLYIYYITLDRTDLIAASARPRMRIKSREIDRRMEACKLQTRRRLSIRLYQRIQAKHRPRVAGSARVRMIKNVQITLVHVRRIKSRRTAARRTTAAAAAAARSKDV